jgi:Replication initiator protein A
MAALSVERHESMLVSASTSSGDETWRAMQADIQERIGNAGYALSLSSAVGEVLPDHLLIRVSTAFAARRCEESFIDIIAEVALAHIGHELPIRFVVDEELGKVQEGEQDRYEVEILRVPPPPSHGVRARIENNLARKAIFNLDGTRSREMDSPATEDLVGTVALRHTMGELGALEMDMLTWVLGRWKRGENRLAFSKRQLARDLGRSWSGRTGDELTDGLLRLRHTTITGRRWLAAEKRHIERDASIFQEIIIDEHRESRDGRATTPAQVTVVLANWLADQLERGQYADLEWKTYRHALTTPFSRRLYHVLECEEGRQDGTLVAFRVDNPLMAALGTKDSNPRRLRDRLEKAGEMIRAARPHYVSITVDYDEPGGEWWLNARRSPDWIRERAERRREETWRGPRPSVIQAVASVG